MKVLKPGYYFISIVNEELLNIETKEDFSSFVKNFYEFISLNIDVDGDIIRLVKDQNNNFSFIACPCLGNIGLVISNVIHAEYVKNGFVSEKVTDEFA